MIKVGKYEIDDSRSRGKIQYHTTCPACPDAGKTNLKDTPLSVNSQTKQYNCHKCGWSGSYAKYEENNQKSFKVEEVQYTKPKISNMTNLSEKHVNYMFLRGIKQVTLKRNKVFTGENKGVQNDWINFPYYDGEELINVKSRKSEEKKVHASSRCKPYHVQTKRYYRTKQLYNFRG